MTTRSIKGLVEQLPNGRHIWNKFENVLDLFPVAICLTQDGILKKINPTGSKLYGYDSPEEMIGIDMYSFPGEEYKDILDERKDVLMNKKDSTVPILVLKVNRKDGSSFYAKMASTIIAIDEDYVLTIVNDVTELVLNKVETQKLNEELNEKVASITRLVDELKGIEQTYINILQSVVSYIETDDLGGLKKYYHSAIVKAKGINSNSISLILLNNDEIRRVVARRIEYAAEIGIHINMLINGFVEFSDFNINDLCSCIEHVLTCHIQKSLQYGCNTIGVGLIENEENISLLLDVGYVSDCICMPMRGKFSDLQSHSYKVGAKYVQEITIPKGRKNIL